MCVTSLQEKQSNAFRFNDTSPDYTADSGDFLARIIHDDFYSNR